MRPEKTAITGRNSCFGAHGAGDFHFSCVLCRSKGGADAHAPETAIFALDVLGEGQSIPAGVLQQELAELLLCDGRFQIIFAPLGVGTIEICGTLFTVRTEADVSLCLHELAQVVAVFHGCFEVPAGALADGELIAVRQQTVQPLQHPEQDTGEFCGQLLNEERVIDAGGVSVFYRDQDLPAPSQSNVYIVGNIRWIAYRRYAVSNI